MEFAISSILSQKTVVNGTEIVAFTEKRIYSLKLKLNVQPPSATVLRHTKTMLGSMLFSPKFSDVTLVCPDGAEIPAHQVILSGNSLYFDTYFSGLWAEATPRRSIGNRNDAGCNQTVVVARVHRRDPA